MTKKEAKELTVEVWEYLRDHGHCSRKSDLPIKVLNKIKGMIALCPLCDLFEITMDHADCSPCPLGGKSGICPMWGSWNMSPNDEVRSKAAGAIVDKVKAWEIE